MAIHDSIWFPCTKEIQRVFSQDGSTKPKSISNSKNLYNYIHLMNSFSSITKIRKKSYLYDWLDTLQKKTHLHDRSLQNRHWNWCFFKVVPAPYEGGPSMYGSLSWATWKNIRISALWWWMACQERPSVKDATAKKHNPMGFFTKKQHRNTVVFLKLWWILLLGKIQVFGCWSWILTKTLARRAYFWRAICWFRDMDLPNCLRRDFFL